MATKYVDRQIPKVSKLLELAQTFAHVVYVSALRGAARLTDSGSAHPALLESANMLQDLIARLREQNG